MNANGSLRQALYIYGERIARELLISDRRRAPPAFNCIHTLGLGLSPLPNFPPQPQRQREIAVPQSD